ncbi:MAG: hypothetical protein P1U58_16390, partial [Verrucomicrobiales bacterium]|nr:hypothetical protein [Verrucomicrobiales bacterium]
EVAIAFFAALPIKISPLLQKVDTAVFQEAPSLAGAVHLLLLGLVLGPSTFLMGATVPLFGRLVEMVGGQKITISRLYALNTLGAVFMVGFVAFVLLPEVGRAESAGLVLVIHAAAGVIALIAEKRSNRIARAGGGSRADPISAIGRTELILAVTSGLAILALEVIWFRLLKIAWLNTTDAFAVMLMAFLLALFSGARLSRWPMAAKNPAAFLFAGAILSLLATPLLERFDGWSVSGGAYGMRMVGRILMAIAVMGPPVILMGVCLPALLDKASEVKSWGRLYGANTAGAVLGSLGAAWVLFPLAGPVGSSWIVGGAVAGVSLFLLPPRIKSRRAMAGAVLMVTLAMVINFSTGVGTSRIPGPTSILRGDHRVIAHRDAPDASTSVVAVEPPPGSSEAYRLLFIDGYAASGEFGPFSHYMVEMGRLPVAYHPDPGAALVICYGTGQTANAVRNYGAAEIDIVDINPAVFELSEYFPSNEKVLEDERVATRVMDGRAWLRRSGETYDVVTLEPMPPFFTGSNALYSTEFYKVIKRQLNDGGMVAQWFPMHLMSTVHAKAVAASFLDVFPSAVLWIDPLNRDSGGAPQQGILLGIQGSAEELKERLGVPTPVEVALMPDQLAKFIEGANRVTDDNQLLAYGKDGLHRFDLSRRRFAAETYAAVREAAAESE